MLKIVDFKSGQTINNQILMLSSLQKRKFQNKNSFYLNLTLQDGSGIIEGRLWNIPENMNDIEISDGVYVRLDAVVEEYMGKLQLNISSIEIIEDESNIDKSMFLPFSKYSREQRLKDLYLLINKIVDEEYKNFITKILFDENIFEKYLTGIGGIKHHHVYIGGLMEHSLQVTYNALSMAENPYGFSELDKDLIIVGGLLHDIGKIDEYIYSKSFNMNPYGIEHRYKGIGIIEKLIFKHNIQISEEKLKKIENIIISHHGIYGDETIKMETPEAVAIHNADAASAHINGMLSKK